MANTPNGRYKSTEWNAECTYCLPTWEDNTRADALSQNPTEIPDQHALDIQVAALLSKDTAISTLLHSLQGDESPCDLDAEQQKDPELCQTVF